MEQIYVALRDDPTLALPMSLLSIEKRLLSIQSEAPEPSLQMYLVKCTRVHQADYGLLVLDLAAENRQPDLGVSAVTVPTHLVLWMLNQALGSPSPIGFL